MHEGFRKKSLKKVVAASMAILCMANMIALTPETFQQADVSIVALAYSTGNYKVNTSSGINVRSGAGTGYSVQGAAKNGTTFTVDQISGSWGHTNSISCTNGYRSGWVCLTYCSAIASSTVSSFTASTYKVTASSGLNVRTGAGTGYSVKTAVRYGTYLYITSKSGDWGYSPTVGGYVSMNYLSFVGNGDKTGSGSSSSASYKTPLTSGAAYYISPACATSNVLDVCDWKTANGTNVLSYAKHGGNNQRFKAVYISNGYYAFYDVNSGKVLDVSGGVVANGTNVQIYQYNGAAAQLWRLYEAGNGYYYLQSKLNSSYYLDVNGASSANNANIQLYQGNSSSAQKFKFTKVSTSSSSTSSSSTSVKLNVPSFKQGDSRWKNVYIGTKTIGAVGCIITSVAMAYSYNTNSTVYPNTVKNKLRFANNSIYWDSVSNCGLSYHNYGGSTINQTIMQNIYNKLKAGRPVVIWCQNASGNAHAVCVTGYSGSTSTFSASNFTINDPGYSRTNLQQHLNYVNKVYYIMY